MVTPKFLSHVADGTRQVAEDMEDEILFVILLLLLSGDVVTPATVYARVNAVVTHYKPIGALAIRKAIRNTIRQLSTPNVAEMTSYEKELIRHWDKVSQETWTNLTETEAYASVQTYVREVDAAAQAIANGQAHDKVWKDTARRLGSSGMPITTSDGRTEQVSTAVERNLRTSVSRLAGDLELESAKRGGFNLVLVSAHLGARPTHEAWQGKVYSLNGKTDKYDDFKTSTGYGEMLGLCGINCRHSFSPWAEGMPNPYEDFDSEESRKRWAIEQEQRRLERRVRALKRKLREAEAECEAFPDDPECDARRKAIRKKWIDARRDYKSFCAANDLRPLEERLTD